MTENTRLKLAFGRQNFPDTVQAVWGARLIWPNDLVHDRQDLAAHNAEARAELIAWLNGPNAGDGALRKALDVLKVPTALGLNSTGPEEAVIYEDDKGKIIGSAQSSYGYLYVAGWLK
jgi:hypothetical protein